MARPALRYVCQSCGAAYPKWSGRCESCGSWNSLAEESDAAAVRGAKTSARGGRVIVAAQHTANCPNRGAKPPQGR